MLRILPLRREVSNIQAGEPSEIRNGSFLENYEGFPEAVSGLKPFLLELQKWYRLRSWTPENLKCQAFPSATLWAFAVLGVPWRCEVARFG